MILEDKADQHFKNYVEILNEHPGANNTLFTIEKTPLKQGWLSGICLGASLSIIKTLLNIDVTSEDELIGVCKKYEKGFSSKAAALQTIFLSLSVAEPKLKEILENLAVNVEEIKDISEDQMRGLIYQILIILFPLINSLIGLKKIKIGDEGNNVNFTGIHNDPQVMERFNHLDKGVYLLTLASLKGSHALTYIKTEFGAYIVDPNHGLIKCLKDNPAQKLCQLLKQGHPRALDESHSSLMKSYFFVWPYQIV